MRSNLQVTSGKLKNSQFARIFGFQLKGTKIAQKTSRRTRLSPQARREQLIEIGASIFAERAFDDVFLEEVAERAGVSRALIYHYFPNKRDFHGAVIRHSLQSSFEMTAPDLDLPPERWLPDGIDKLLGVAEGNADAFRAVHASRNSHDESVREAIRDGRDAQITRICEVVSPDRPPSAMMRASVDAWIELLDALIIKWLDGDEVDRSSVVEVASGALTGTLIATFIADGRADEIASVRQLMPSGFQSL